MSFTQKCVFFQYLPRTAVALFAKLSPLQKARLVRVMRELLGHTVGFMGDAMLP